MERNNCQQKTALLRSLHAPTFGDTFDHGFGALKAVFCDVFLALAPGVNWRHPTCRVLYGADVNNRASAEKQGPCGWVHFVRTYHHFFGNRIPAAVYQNSVLGWALEPRQHLTWSAVAVVAAAFRKLLPHLLIPLVEFLVLAFVVADTIGRLFLALLSVHWRARQDNCIRKEEE